jgi:glycosyltransferase involved in cell wall biosynthesis
VVDFTVTICTYNGANQLPQVLDRLLVQQHTDNLSWDVLIVDNHSTDSTAAWSATINRNGVRTRRCATASNRARA